MDYIRVITSMFATNTYIIYNDKNEAFLIDPGADAELIDETLNKHNLTVKFVLLTHGHFDHCNAARVYQDRGAYIFMNKHDLKLINSDKNLAKQNHIDFIPFTPDAFVGDGDTINILGFSIHCYHTPGHTPGGMTYQLEDLLFTGDTLFRLGAGRTDFPLGNQSKLKKSLQKLFALEGDFTVLSGHGAPTKLSFERKNNPYA